MRRVARERTDLRRAILSMVLAFMVPAAVILGRFPDEALPASFLVRPLLLAAVLAAFIGVACRLTGERAPVVATAAALLVAAPDPLLVLPLAAIMLIEELRRRRGRSAEALIPILVGAFFAVGLLRTIPLIEAFPAGSMADAEGPSTYVVLLDGYPRMDSLAGLGIDNRPFVDELEARGFDHYADATSLHVRTHETLQAMLTTQAVVDDSGTVEEQRAIRRQLVVPHGFVAVDPAIGYVTLGPGNHIDGGGLTDFEIELLGISAVGVVAPDAAWSIALEGLRARIERALDLMASGEHRRLFVHLMAPHPPFLHGSDGSEDAPRWCWPGCGAFTNQIEFLKVTKAEWADGMAAQLEYLNGLLLGAIDSVLARDPDAVIVLFSDHGGRYSEHDRDEWNRTFLAARTPGHPGLFADAPRPDVIIRSLFDAYRGE